MSTNARQAKASKLALGTTSRRCSRKYSSYSVARDALDSRVRRVHQLLVHRDTAPVKAGQLSQRNSTFLCKIRTYRRFMTRQSWRDSLNPWYINLSGRIGVTPPAATAIDGTGKKHYYYNDKFLEKQRKLRKGNRAPRTNRGNAARIEGPRGATSQDPRARGLRFGRFAFQFHQKGLESSLYLQGLGQQRGCTTPHQRVSAHRGTPFVVIARRRRRRRRWRGRRSA